MKEVEDGRDRDSPTWRHHQFIEPPLRKACGLEMSSGRTACLGHIDWWGLGVRLSAAGNFVSCFKIRNWCILGQKEIEGTSIRVGTSLGERVNK